VLPGKSHKHKNSSMRNVKGKSYRPVTKQQQNKKENCFFDIEYFQLTHGNDLNALDGS
jgi:hypothetical protein